MSPNRHPSRREVHGKARTLPMSNTLYDRLRAVAQYWLPGLGAFYFAIANIWGLPYAEEVLGTIAAIEVLLGTVLGLSNKSYYDTVGDPVFDGQLVVNKEDALKDTYTLELDVPLYELDGREEIVLQVKNTDLEGDSQ